MTDTKIWILMGLISTLLPVAWWGMRRWARRIDVKFDNLINEVKKISELTARQDERIKVLERKTEIHSERIREIERVQDKCKNFKLD